MVKLTVPDNVGAATSAAVRQSLGETAKTAYLAKLQQAGVTPLPEVRVDVYVQYADGTRSAVTKVVVSSGRRLSSGDTIVMEVYLTPPEGLSGAELTAAQASLDAGVAALPANVGSDPAFDSLLSLTGATATELSAAPAESNAAYQVSASPPPPCAMQCTQLMNGLSKNAVDMCIKYGTDSQGNPDPDDLQCYPYGYNGCDSGMTHCNQKVCASSDKKPSKCQKKLIDKGKISKCRKKKWGRKKCKKTCCEAGY